MSTERRNILTVEKGIIVHQVNCMGVMGSGLAKSIREKWPVVFQQYKNKPPVLGDIQMVSVATGLVVCNLAGQDRYGKDAVHTDYTAVRSGLKKLSDWNTSKLTIHIPHKMSCGLGGGGWSMISDIIDEELVDHTVIICEL